MNSTPLPEAEHPLLAASPVPPPLSEAVDLARDAAEEGAGEQQVGAYVGLSLEDIGTELSKLPPDRAPTRRDWSRLSAGWSARIDRRIAELERLKAGLTECIGCGCLSLDRCRLANPGDRAGRLGAGPRYWIGDRPIGA